MRYSNCRNCEKEIAENDHNPNVHYSEPSTDCGCKSKDCPEKLPTPRSSAEKAQMRIVELENALYDIYNWRMPKVELFEGREVPYSFWHGSNGEKDIIKNIAKKALFKE